MRSIGAVGFTGASVLVALVVKKKKEVTCIHNPVIKAIPNFSSGNKKCPVPYIANALNSAKKKDCATGITKVSPKTSAVVIDNAEAKSQLKAINKRLVKTRAQLKPFSLYAL